MCPVFCHIYTHQVCSVPISVLRFLQNLYATVAADGTHWTECQFSLNKVQPTFTMHFGQAQWILICLSAVKMWGKDKDTNLNSIECGDVKSRCNLWYFLLVLVQLFHLIWRRNIYYVSKGPNKDTQYPYIWLCQNMTEFSCFWMIINILSNTQVCEGANLSYLSKYKGNIGAKLK